MVLTEINKIQHPHVGRNCGICRLCYVESSVLTMTLKLFHSTPISHSMSTSVVNMTGIGPNLFFGESIKFRGGFRQNVRFRWNFEKDHAHILVVGL